MSEKEFRGVCTSKVSYTIDAEGLVRNVEFSKGCDGNLKAVARLAEGRPAVEVAALLGDVTCGSKNTSCPAQFAQALLDDTQAG